MPGVRPWAQGALGESFPCFGVCPRARAPWTLADLQQLLSPGREGLVLAACRAWLRP